MPWPYQPTGGRTVPSIPHAPGPSLIHFPFAHLSEGWHSVAAVAAVQHALRVYPHPRYPLPARTQHAFNRVVQTCKNASRPDGPLTARLTWLSFAAKLLHCMCSAALAAADTAHVATNAHGIAAVQRHHRYEQRPRHCSSHAYPTYQKPSLGILLLA